MESTPGQGGYGRVIDPRPPPPPWSIGTVADIADVPATTLRHYERIGLLDPPRREGGKRRYDESVLLRLMLIRFCRIAGLGLEEIREVVADDSPGRRRTKEIAAARVEAIDAQLAELQLARDMMRAAVVCTCARPDECTCGAIDHVVERVRARTPL